MKVRTSFVSNSSSSSFCVFGVVLSKEQQEKSGVLRKDKWGDYHLHIEDNVSLDYCDGLGDIYEDNMSIGIQPTGMKDQETVLEFKQRVFEELKKLNLDIAFMDLKWITDGGYEG
jgi:hypothetical protein